jgi:hypothetical protein
MVLVQFGFLPMGHPERSRFSGGAKDLSLYQLRARAKMHHYRFNFDF